MAVVVISVACSGHRHLRLLDHTSEKCFRPLRPLLKIIFFARELLRTTKAFHVDELGVSFRT